MRNKPFLVGFAAGVVLGVAALLALGSVSDGSGGASTAGQTGQAPAETTAAERPPTVAIASIEAEAQAFTLVAVGDILLARRVGERIASAGWAAPFAAFSPILASADLAFANLECPASYLGAPYPGKPPVVTFRAQPGSLLGLKGAGFDIVSLANNHTSDYGEEALGETLDALDTLGVARAGAGRDAKEARRPAILTVNGARVAFLAYVEPMWSATEATMAGGVAHYDAAETAADIAAAREVADFVIVSLHWGEEHRRFPREKDRAIARSLIDAGADAILGHHPHILQGAEFYRGAPILYSLGNFIFDMVSPKTYESAAAMLRFERGARTTLRLLPLRIDAATFAPEAAVGEDGEAIGRLIRDRSAALGSPSLRRPDGFVEILP